MKKNMWTKFFVLLFVIYIAISVFKVIQQNYKVNKEVEALKNEITELKTMNKEYSERILYYQSPSYREKIARERLGLQKPGEEVVVILPEERPKTTEENPDDKLPNYLKWWNYFFKV